MLPDNYTYRPLPASLYIGFSDIDGNGLFAKEGIAKDVVLGITHVYYEGFENGLIRTPLGGYINHSLSPNCIIFKSCDEFYSLKTILEIKVGEELSANYFNSDCAKNCGL